MTAKSAFNERLLFVLWRWKGKRGGQTTDKEFAAAVDRSATMITDWKKEGAPVPPAETVLIIAKEADVDPGWLTHGSESGAPEPGLFSDWLLEYRAHRPRSANSKRKSAAQFNKELADKNRNRGKGGA